MKRKINNIAKNIDAMSLKVIEVTKDNYTLENGDVFEHTFEIDENITLEQEMLFYVDAHRFYDVYNSKSIAEICIENLFK